MNLIPEKIDLSGDANVNIEIDQQSTINLVIACISIITFYFLAKKITL